MYEFELANTWDITPEIGYKLKDFEYGDISISINIGKNFGRK